MGGVGRRGAVCGWLGRLVFGGRLGNTQHDHLKSKGCCGVGLLGLVYYLSSSKLHATISAESDPLGGVVNYSDVLISTNSPSGKEATYTTWS